MAYASTKALGARLNAEPLAWSRHDLLAEFSAETLKRAIERRMIKRLLPGTYVGATWAADVHARLSAVSSWGSEHVAVTGLAGAHIYKWFSLPPNRIEIVCPREMRVPAPFWLAPRRPRYPAHAQYVGGVRVAARAEVIVRCWESLPASRATSFVIDALRDPKIDTNTVMAHVASLARVKRRQELLALLTLVETGVESYLEYVAATEVFVGPDFKQFTRQVDYRVNGTRYRIDMLHEAANVAVEVDGAKFHSSDWARRRDIERDAVLASVGILTLRFTFEDITQRPQWCRNRVLDTVRSRLAA